ncbi:MAG: SprB repeat-containing protein, partial [Flavobacteriales bacterium]|nr:SprB repeat-containing protein [Flavobacteriales bacterium]
MKFIYLISLFAVLPLYVDAQTDCPTSINSSATNELTYGGCDGTVTIITTGGTPPFTFYIEDITNPLNSYTSPVTIDTSFVFPAVCPTTYDCYVINSLGDTCVLGGGGLPSGGGGGSGTGAGMLGGGAGSGSSATVNPATPNLTVDCFHYAMCVNEYPTYNTATATGDAPPFEYSFDGGSTWSLSSTSPTAWGGCTSPFQAVMARDATGQVVSSDCFPDAASPCYLPVDPQITSFDESCPGACDGGAVIGVTSSTFNPEPGPYNVSVDGWPVGVISDFNSTLTVTGYCPGTYSVTVNAFCFIGGMPAAITVGSPSLLTYSAAITNESCSVSCDGQIILSTSGGTSPYQYSIDCGVTFQSSASFGSLCNGTFCTVIEDDNGCQIAGSETISTISSGLLLAIDSTTNESITAASDGIIYCSATGGNLPYQYSINGATWQSSSTFSSLTTGTYTVCVMDVNGCSNCVTVSIASGVTCTLSTSIYGTNPTCENSCDGSSVISPLGNQGPLSYLWSNLSTSNSISGLCNAEYSVIVTDSVGCQAKDTINIYTSLITSNIVANACDSFITSLGNAIYNTGMYYYTLISVNGCDSIVALDLTINYSNSETDVISACDAYTWTDGITY